MIERTVWTVPDPSDHPTYPTFPICKSDILRRPLCCNLKHPPCSFLLLAKRYNVVSREPQPNTYVHVAYPYLHTYLPYPSIISTCQCDVADSPCLCSYQWRRPFRLPIKTVLVPWRSITLHMPSQARPRRAIAATVRLART